MDTPTSVNNNLSLESSAHISERTIGLATDPKTQDSAVPQELYERLKAYPFISDHEFAKGLAIILGHPDAPATEAEIGRGDDLVLQAKCFYFSRKEKLAHSVNFAAYKDWLESTPAVNSSIKDEATGSAPHWRNIQAIETTPSTKPMNQASASVQEPAYPSSFAHIVELITTGQPIPGIQQIPDTVLIGHDTPSTKPERRKPWEKEGKIHQT
ncbi:hypothetical protein BBP40_011867 [Aspergillus hancockii]|nr:hypothetical protein BBP40_011867 [Aspergillus hancockii]